MSIYYPMKLRPLFKSYVWGGDRLKRSFGKTDAPPITSESWELSCHPEGCSQVDTGMFAGRTIQELGALDCSAFWGTSCSRKEFPILVKLVDANKPLSIQVHPSDQTANPALGEHGKAEMWYIVDCEPQSYLYLGFSQHMTPESFLQSVSDHKICQVLNRVEVAPGDIFYVLPGTIHAIGPGIVIAEIQQNSNTTFRIYDYHRLGLNGSPRPLHLKRAAEVLHYAPILPRECRSNRSLHVPGFTMDEMFTCEYFRSYRLDLHTSIELFCNGSSFHHLLCVGGNCTIQYQNDLYPVTCGDSYFMPAALGHYGIHGQARILFSQI